jgi:methionyl-tRNA formyltransferase
MIINQELDQGPLLAQIPVTVQADWTARDYYSHCFDLMAERLADLVAKFGTGSLPPQAQPLLSPTPTARRLSKQDAFIDWHSLREILTQKTATSHRQINSNNLGLLSEMLSDELLCPSREKQQQLLNNASHAFWPWPGLWTIVQTNKGEKRMKIMPFRGNELDIVQIEGKTPCPWRECRNSVRF